MDSNHVEVENKIKFIKPSKKYLVFYLMTEGQPEQYVTVNSMEEAFVKKVGLEAQQAISIKIFQEVNLKVQIG